MTGGGCLLVEINIGGGGSAGQKNMPGGGCLLVEKNTLGVGCLLIKNIYARSLLVKKKYDRGRLFAGIVCLLVEKNMLSCAANNNGTKMPINTSF